MKITDPCSKTSASSVESLRGMRFVHFQFQNRHLTSKSAILTEDLPVKLLLFSLWHETITTLTMQNSSFGIVYWPFSRIRSDIDQESGLAEEKERLPDTPVRSGYNQYIFVHQPAHIPRL